MQPIETQTGSQPTRAVIWLHGLGADGHDFAPLVPALETPDNHPTRFVFPHAHMRPITLNGGMKMRGWYDIADPSFTRDEDRQGIARSTTILNTLIHREIHRGIPPASIFLAGFSQGGAMALHTGLRFDQPLAGIIALSTYLPLADSLETERTPANRHTPIFLAHGIHDPLIPFHLARTGQHQLTRAGYPVFWREYPIEHNVCPEEIADVGDFLRAPPRVRGLTSTKQKSPDNTATK